MQSPSRIVCLTAVLSVIGVTAAGCGSSSSSSTSKPPVAATHTAKSTSNATTQSAGLSGTWSGRYGGAYSGTFNLDWKQSGSNLSGTIKLSTQPGTMTIHGTMNGGAIQFGTVGSLAITYTGTVSGSSMSGNYHTPVGSGSWSANKA